MNPENRVSRIIDRFVKSIRRYPLIKMFFSLYNLYFIYVFSNYIYANQKIIMFIKYFTYYFKYLFFLSRYLCMINNLNLELYLFTII